MTPQADSPDAKLDAALDALLDLAGEARAAAFDDLAKRDPALAQRVARVLAAENSQRLEQVLGRLANDFIEQQAGLEPGTVLGAWQIDRLLGDGGMGRVYLAHRADGAFEMQAALKVLRPELALPAEVLQHERNLLARLKHPALTHLLDGGISADGHVYLVMELVEGPSLRQWLATNRPDVAARLDVFEAVCDAIVHAHHQRVVHGDIKPSNIVVDTGNRPRVLDFGIAQIADANPVAQALLAPALTPGYAPPERHAGAPATVHTDVYALGKLLAFLLQPPPDDPPVPTRIRHVKDLKSIIAQATADMPADRYPSVGALLADLANWRDGRPVTARTTGRIHAMLRFTGRHKIAVGLTTVALAALIGGSSTLLWQNRVIRAERDQARAAEARSDTVLDYLVGIIGQVGQAGSELKLPLNQVLATNLANIERDVTDDSAARQRLLAHLAELHVRMNDYATATDLLQRIGPLEETADVLVKIRVLDNSALVALHDNRIDEARQGVDAAMDLLAAEVGDRRGSMSQVLVTQALIEQREGELDKAIATLRRALELRLAVSPADAVQTVVVRNSLALALMRNGDYPAALAEFRILDQALTSSRRQQSLDAASIDNNHAAAAFLVGQYDEAAQQFSRARELQTRFFGPSAAMAALLSNYGKLQLARGELEAGTEMIQQAEAMMRQFVGPDSIDAQLTRLATADAASANGDHGRALAILDEVEQALTPKLGAGHPVLQSIRAGALRIRASADMIAPDDPAFDASLQDLDGPSGSRQRAELACSRSELALRRDMPQLASIAADTCLSAWQITQDAASPRLTWARFLQAEADWRHTGVATQRQTRDEILQSVRQRLPARAPEHRRLAILASN